MTIYFYTYRPKLQVNQLSNFWKMSIENVDFVLLLVAAVYIE